MHYLLSIIQMPLRGLSMPTGNMSWHMDDAPLFLTLRQQHCSFCWRALQYYADENSFTGFSGMRLTQTLLIPSTATQQPDY